LSRLFLHYFHCELGFVKSTNVLSQVGIARNENCQNDTPISEYV
jgi:hypothetical protein